MVTYAPPEGSIPTLEVPNLNECARIHMIGVGGAGMSGIAVVLLAKGIEVTGSDIKESKGLQALRDAGATVHAGHDATNLGAADAVVISSAIPAANPELTEARKRGTPVYARAQVLAALGRGQQVFAIAGTHGKTTTTSMLAVILDRAGVEPTFVIGGDLNESGSNAHAGGGEVFVVEADESDGSFLLLAGDVGIVTNVEVDHTDFYTGGEPEIVAAFEAFIRASGAILACGDDAGVRAAIAGVCESDPSAASSILTYGIDPSNDAVLHVLASDDWDARAELTRGATTVELRLRVPGVHNLLNASAAVLAATHAGVELGEAADALATFTGVRRRFEYRGAARGAEFFDDYAHHPTEIAATLDAAVHRQGHARVIAIFQPHRYSRTESLWRELGTSLEAADVVAVTDVYAAGEAPIPGVSGKLLVDALAETGRRRRLLYLPRHGDVVGFLAGEAGPGDLIVTLGAGDITTVADETLERIRADR